MLSSVREWIAAGAVTAIWIVREVWSYRAKKIDTINRLQRQVDELVDRNFDLIKQVGGLQLDVAKLKVELAEQQREH